MGNKGLRFGQGEQSWPRRSGGEGESSVLIHQVKVKCVVQGMGEQRRLEKMIPNK